MPTLALCTYVEQSIYAKLGYSEISLHISPCIKTRQLMKGGVLQVVDLVVGRGRRRMQVGEGCIRVTYRAMCVCFGRVLPC